MIGIYKIENLINGKIYIGQSIHIERRWSEHKRNLKNHPLYNDLFKYGIENFSFDVLEECSIEQLNILEEKYIEKYNSVNPNGYNLLVKSGGNHTVFNLYNYDELQIIIKDIQDNVITLQEIANKNNLSLRTIIRINQGDVHKDNSLSYPLRPVSILEPSFCIDCGKEITNGSNRCKKCNSIYQRRVERPSKEELKNLIRNFSFIDIGKKYSVSDNAIRKWCKNYNLPFSKREIKSYSKEEWEII